MSIFLLGMIVLPSSVEASGGVVEQISVAITASQAPPSRIAKRMSASVETVGEQMLVGRKVSEVDGNKAVYEKLIREIFDRVLVGYSVQGVQLTPGTRTTLDVTIVPWGEVVREVGVEVNFGTMDAHVIELVKADMGNVEEQINEVLVGLPIDAVDWAGGVSKMVILELLNSRLPEFQVNFEIIPGPRTTVTLSLAPRGATVQDVRVSLRSHTIPNLLLMAVRPTVDDAGNTLVGVPVAFIERHHGYFTTSLAKKAAQHRIAQDYGLQLTPRLHEGIDTEIVLDAETDKYKVSIEGYMDMGRREDNTSFQLHAGKFINKQDELFMEVHFIPSTVSWKFIPGWGHNIGVGTTVGIKYDLSDKQNILWMEHNVNRSLSMRIERTPASNLNQFGIRYKMHDFLSAEYVFTKENKWLRLISSL